MCGRFTLRAPASAIAEQFGLFDVPTFAARFNIAPTQPVPVVRQHDRARELTWLRWGLVPSWAKDVSIGARLINARAETAAEKPAFRSALARRRCLVVADGFYEWQHTGRTKQPYFIRLRDDRSFALAGLWDVWEGPDHASLESSTLLTTEANDLVRPIHDRMPVILRPEAYATWLDPTIEDARQLAPLLVPFPSEPMEAYAVATFVNSPTNEGSQCIAPKA